MPTLNLVVPPFPESVREGTLTAWHRKAGEAVAKGDKIADIETDKIVLDVTAPGDGVLAAIAVREGTTVQAGQVIGSLEAGGKPAAAPQPAQVAEPVAPPKKKEKAAPPAPATQPVASPPPPPAPPVVAPAPVPPPLVRAAAPPAPPAAAEDEGLSEDELSAFSPSVRRLLAEHKLNPAEITGHGRGGRLTKADVLRHLEHSPHLATQFGADAVDPEALAPAEPEPAAPAAEAVDAARPEHRVKMSRLRQRIAQRLVEVQQQAAILTTFNEVNMAAVMGLRARYKEAFEKEHGVKLGFLSFFVKAAIEALARFPAVNASVEGEDIVYHGYFDIGVAVSTERGLVVPVLRDAEQLSPAAIERQIADFGKRAQAGQLGLEELRGGTFTISNGGVFGSLMSTPILNPPQSGILGMHKIQDRPVAENGQVVIRPMMYLALSYDHRIIDGREAVSFLATIKDLIEDPTRLWLQV